MCVDLDDFHIWEMVCHVLGEIGIVVQWEL